MRDDRVESAVLVFHKEKAVISNCICDEADDEALTAYPFRAASVAHAV